MNKVKLMMMTLMMCLMTMVSFGQSSKDSVYVVKETDAMSGKTYVYGNRAFIVANDAGKIGFRISTYINSDKLSFSMITATMVGIGGCNENDEIIILFENGEKITKTSWKEFNCDGKTYFYMNEKDIQLLRTQPLSKIRMTNGRTYDSYTGDVKQKDKRYFIQLFYALDNNLITEKKYKNNADVIVAITEYYNKKRLDIINKYNTLAQLGDSAMNEALQSAGQGAQKNIDTSISSVKDEPLDTGDATPDAEIKPIDSSKYVTGLQAIKEAYKDTFSAQNIFGKLNNEVSGSMDNLATTLVKGAASMKDYAAQIAGKRPNAREWNYYEDNERIPIQKKKVQQPMPTSFEELEMMMRQQRLI